MIATSEAASCCAEFYEQSWVQEWMGDSFHPGGLSLSRRSLDSLALDPGARVLDLAAGTGTTAIELASSYGAVVDAVDVSVLNLDRIRTRASDAGVGASITIHEADASSLPFADASFDAAISECAFSTFEDKAAVAVQLARVLRPGARLAISDMAVDGELPAELGALLGPWACLGDALPIAGYRRVFVDAGLRVLRCDDESEALHELARDLKRRLVMFGLGTLAGLIPEGGIDLEALLAHLEQARALVDAGTVQYARLLLRR